MSSTIIADLNSASVQITRYLSIGLLLFGIIGNLLNSIVFTQRTLRSNPCAVYFLVASLLNVVVLVSGLTPALFANLNIAVDLTATVPAWCKLRITALFTVRTIVSWIIVLATIDRYLVSSANVNRRQMSSLKRAYHWITITCILSFLVWAETIYCFDANMIGTPLKCYAKSDACRVYNDLAQALITTIIPSTVILVFGLGTISHIRQTRRIRPITNGASTNAPVGRRKTENSLSRMLLIQVLLLSIFNFPQAAQKFYLTYTFYQSKSSVQIAIENFLFNIFLNLGYTPNCISFYLYTFSGSVFRETLRDVGRITLRRLTCDS